jgi:CHAT domain-containing protein
VSGQTTEVTSREALGMMWALFRAGSSSVVAGMWKVDVVSAQALLTGFYEHLARGQAVAHALRAAALDLRAGRTSWSHPFHFAAFSLFGYWE